MTIGSLPMACTEIGTEFSTAVPFTLANGTLLALGGLAVPYLASAWVGKTAAAVVNPMTTGSGLCIRAGAPCGVKINYKTDGTVTITKFDANGSFSGGLTGNWYLPTTASIGNSYWVRGTVIAGESDFSGAGHLTTGTWYALTSDRFFSIFASGTDIALTADFDLSTDSSGTPIVASMNSPWMVIEADAS